MTSHDSPRATASGDTGVYLLLLSMSTPTSRLYPRQSVTSSILFNMTNGHRGCCSVRSRKVVLSSPGILRRSGGAVLTWSSGKEWWCYFLYSIVFVILQRKSGGAVLRRSSRKEWWCSPLYSMVLVVMLLVQQ